MRLHQAGGSLADQGVQDRTPSIKIERVEDIALRLGHLLAVVASRIRPVDIDIAERDIVGMNFSPIIIIRATQKKMMSKPVTRTLVG